LEAGCGLTNHTFGLTARFPFLGGEFPKVMKVIGAPGLLEVGFLSFFLASLGPQAPGKRGTQPSRKNQRKDVPEKPDRFLTFFIFIWLLLEYLF
jgi:hypothetical protein